MIYRASGLPEPGERFNHWEVIVCGREAIRASGHAMTAFALGMNSAQTPTIARCRCGEVSVVSLYTLRKGLSKSCRTCAQLIRRGRLPGLDARA